ncbi:MAG: tyrosine-protein phosphatase [Pseudomonadales bacterium]|nr:tyrosine-protein phosphatase [Pseudomonadales bacterium]
MQDNLALSDRVVDLQSVSNFRDLGGYPTACGRSVKWGKLFRSATLTHASDQDIDTIVSQLGINHVIDLRKARELDLEPQPERLLAHIHYHWLPINLDGTTREDIDRRLAEGSAAEAFEGLLIDVNRNMVLQHQDDVKRWFDIVLHAETPILFHCTEGKDRTGFTAAIFLLAMGVEKDVVMQDYLLTNLTHRKSIAERIASSAVLSSFEVDAKDLERLLSVDEDYLNAGLAQIEQSYGSVSAYLEQALDIDAEKLALLKQKYLS